VTEAELIEQINKKREELKALQDEIKALENELAKLSSKPKATKKVFLDECAG